MATVKLTLNLHTHRPITNIMGLNTLIDTGANISLANVTKEVFKMMFPNIVSEKPWSIKGIGGDCVGMRYVVKEYRLSEDFSLQNVEFFVPDDTEGVDTSYYLILSNKALEGTIFTVDTINGILTITRPD